MTSRPHWTIKKYDSLEAMKDDEIAYWRSRPDHERALAVWDITRDAYEMTGRTPDAQRLQRTIVHLKR